VDERKSQMPLQDEGGPLGSETVLPAAIDRRWPADGANIASSRQVDDVRRHIHDTITFCGDPATVREGFAIALDVLEAYADLLPSDALVPTTGHTRKGD
jgi:hypothetical protein